MSQKYEKIINQLRGKERTRSHEDTMPLNQFIWTSVEIIVLAMGIYMKVFITEIQSREQTKVKTIAINKDKFYERDFPFFVSIKPKEV